METVYSFQIEEANTWLWLGLICSLSFFHAAALLEKTWFLLPKDYSRSFPPNTLILPHIVSVENSSLFQTGIRVSFWGLSWLIYPDMQIIVATPWPKRRGNARALSKERLPILQSALTWWRVRTAFKHVTVNAPSALSLLSSLIFRTRRYLSVPIMLILVTFPESSAIQSFI